MKWQTIGFGKTKDIFTNIIAEGRLGHAYLFWGEEMIGKRTFAMELCAIINKEQSETTFDTLVVAPKILEDETKIYIEDVRNVKSFLSLKPVFGKYKMVIIDDADRLTPEASNAILKILEEPPRSSIVILISSKPKNLPKTIFSRCHHIYFANHDVITIKNHIAEQDLVPSDYDFLLRLSRGRIGWINQVINDGMIEGIRKDMEGFEGIIKSGVFEKMAFAKKLAEREDCVAVLNNLIYYLSSSPEILTQNKNVLGRLLAAYKIISQPQYNRRLALENLVLSL